MKLQILPNKTNGDTKLHNFKTILSKFNSNHTIPQIQSIPIKPIQPSLYIYITLNSQSPSSIISDSQTLITKMESSNKLSAFTIICMFFFFSTTTFAAKNCPIEISKLSLCMETLFYVGFGPQLTNNCCPIIRGLGDGEAADCLCSSVKSKNLQVNSYAPQLPRLLQGCGKQTPKGFACKI